VSDDRDELLRQAMDALREAALQLEYIDKRSPAGSTMTVIVQTRAMVAVIKAALEGKQ
jgi:hypothetical protein